jgi:Tfp pilus assembly protein PilO
MIVAQAVPPMPPTPPSIPFDPNLFLMNADAPALVMIVLLVMAAATIVLWPIARALARRLEGRGSVDAALRSDVEQLQHRLADMDNLQVRLAELEERLDFTERLLVRGQDAAAEPGRLPRS